MNINKKLINAANYNPTKESRQRSILDLCQMIEIQSLSLPLYQRDMSWTLEKSISLLNYQLLGKSPVSPISINVINDTSIAVPQVSFITRELITKIERGQFSVVDGQQRLTTNFKAYSNHDDLRTVALDLGKGEFVEYRESIRNNQIPAGILLNKDDSVYFDYINSHKTLSSPEVSSVLMQVKYKFKNYNYTINSATDLSEDEQINWFEVLNNAGSRVTAIQMRFSKLKAHGIDIYTQYTNLYREILNSFGYDSFFTPHTTNVSYPIAALNPLYEILVFDGIHKNNFAPISSDTKENLLCSLSPKVLKECFEYTLDYLKQVLLFIDEHELKRPDRIDYINYMIGYFAFHSTPILKTQEEELIGWYKKVQFRNQSNSSRREIYSKLIKM